MNKSSNDECKIGVLQTSCIGQLHEMINLFETPITGVLMSQRNEIELDNLHQRNEVSGVFTIEMKIIKICNGSVIIFSLNSLKQFNEYLNMLEIFAYAHNESEKLSGPILIDVKWHLPKL